MAIKVLLFSICFLFCLFGGFYLGKVFGLKSIDKVILELQADMNFAGYAGLVDIRETMQKNCPQQVSAKIIFYIDEKEKLMAEYIQDEPSQEFINRIDRAIPNYSKKLLNYDVDWKKTIVFPNCKS